MKNYFAILLFLMTVAGCKKSSKDETVHSDCSHNTFSAVINGTSFQTSELTINTNYCGPGQTCPLTNIYASKGDIPPDSFFTFTLANSIPGTYYLGKHDSINYFISKVDYIVNFTPSTGVGYETDSIYNGIVTITKKDEANRKLYGTFNFIARKLMTTDTVLVSVTNGNFEGCY
jgi:hypothetical protein